MRRYDETKHNIQGQNRGGLVRREDRVDKGAETGWNLNKTRESISRNDIPRQLLARSRVEKT